MPVPTPGPSSMPSHRGEDNRDPPTEDDEELEQQQGLFQVPSIQLLGQHVQRVQREQRHLGTHLLWPAGGRGRRHWAPRTLSLPPSEELQPHLRGSREESEMLFSKAPTKAFSHCCR